MELCEMIKVMQHYENGGEVECSEDDFKTVLCTADKERDGDLGWNWDDFKYRIKKEKRVVIEKWLCKDKQGEYVVIDSSNIDKYIQYKKVKLMEIYEVEL